jgi:hypothetical protein
MWPPRSAEMRTTAGRGQAISSPRSCRVSSLELARLALSFSFGAAAPDFYKTLVGRRETLAGNEISTLTRLCDTHRSNP